MRWWTRKIRYPLVGVTALALAIPAGVLVAPTAQASPLPAYPEVSAWLAEPTHPPAPTGAATTVAAFFAAEPAAVDTDLARRYPRIVGGLDGAPAALRYAANDQLAHETGVLLYDPRGDGRIATVAGDLDSADRIAILIPGVATTLGNFAHGLGHVQRRAPQWQAQQLFDAARQADPGSHLAVIAWLGYDPPDGIGLAAAREERAATGAVALRSFVAGLVAQRPGVTITVVGHSYGSVVAGLAAPHLDPAVTDIVALGSPGMGGAHTVSDLHTSARVWAGAAAGDWTRDIPGLQIGGLGHGRLPEDPAFGALPVPVADVTDHDGYFVPGTDTLRALASIALRGEPEEDLR
jgi:Alpha/beta hydrolase